jgi:small GTP-binding protein
LSNEDKLLKEFPHDSQYKICLLGEPLVGKTHLVSAITGRPFTHKPTAGADISHRKLQVSEGREIAAIFWDLSGQPVFKNVRRIFYEGSHALIYAYDVTRPNTLAELTNWIKEIRDNLGECPSILVGNKIDLKGERKIEKELGQKFADKMKAKAFFEASAVTKNNLGDVFKAAIREAIRFRGHLSD